MAVIALLELVHPGWGLKDLIQQEPTSSLPYEVIYEVDQSDGREAELIEIDV